MRTGDDRPMRLGALALAIGAIGAAVGFESWWGQPVSDNPVATTHVESAHERALREKDARIAAIQRLIDELRASMALEFEAPTDDPLGPPRNVGSPVFPACAAATCPELGHIRRPPFDEQSHSSRELNALLDGSAGQLTALIEEHIARREAAERARSSATDR